MALQSSGQISLNDLHVEAGGSSGTECSFNDSDIRDLIDKSSGAQSAMNEFYGASSVTVPVWNGSTYTFDLGTPDVIHTKTGNFTLAYNGAVAIIAIGGGGGGGSESGNSSIGTTGGGGGGVAIKGLIGTTSMSFSASRGSGGTDIDHIQNPNWDGPGLNGGSTTVSGNGISLTAGGGTGGRYSAYGGWYSAGGGSASGGDANYTGGSGPNTAGTSSFASSGGGGAGGGNGSYGSGYSSPRNFSGGTSPLDTGWLAPYIGSGGTGRADSRGRGSNASNYGGGGGGGNHNHASGDYGTGGHGSNGIILVCYWT